MRPWLRRECRIALLQRQLTITWDTVLWKLVDALRIQQGAGLKEFYNKGAHQVYSPKSLYFQLNTYSTLTFSSLSHPEKWTATFGALLKPPSLKRSIKTIIIHEKYHYPEHDYDIALVQLSKRVEFTSSIHRVCLPEPAQVFPYNIPAVITGWGALTNDGES